MADTPTGVTPATGRGRRGRAGGSFFKRNRAVVLGGGALGAFLLMSHKGSTAAAGNTGSNQDQLQATADTLAAETAALQSAGTAPFGVTGGSAGTVGSGDGTGNALTGDPGAASGGGGASSEVASAPTSGPQAGPVNITINPEATPAKPKHPGQKAKPKASKPPQKHPTAKRGAPSHKGGSAAHKPVAAPKQGSQGRPAPATKQGTHPHTANKTPKGKRKKSPAQVESMFGMGAGVVVMGRQFPGAQSHRMGPPFTDAAGRMCRRVILDYGGRSEQMIVHGDGSEWTDNPPGLNPPSRGVPMTMMRSDTA